MASTCSVSSPTAIIWMTMGGNASGTAAHRLRDRPAALDRLVYRLHRLLDDAVARGAPRDVDRLEHRHAGRDERRVGPREARERDLLHDVADFERDLELEAVPLHASALGPLPAAERVDRDDGPEDEHVPAVGDEVRQPDRDLGDGGQLAAEVLEHLLEHQDD